MTPIEVLLEEEVVKVTAEGPNGSFCLLPRHIDFVSLLAPGVLIFEAADGHESFVALDEGVLVKVGGEVLVSVLNAARSPDLGHLRRIVEEQFRELDEHERAVRTTLARLETDFVRRFLELGGFRHE
jgi:F-type H+-transporting ATPase subunit epsilon